MLEEHQRQIFARPWYISIALSRVFTLLCREKLYYHRICFKLLNRLLKDRSAKSHLHYLHAPTSSVRGILPRLSQKEYTLLLRLLCLQTGEYIILGWCSINAKDMPICILVVPAIYCIFRLIYSHRLSATIYSLCLKTFCWWWVRTEYITLRIHSATLPIRLESTK